MSPLTFLDLPCDQLEGEVVACLYFQDQRPPEGPAALLDWRVDEVLSRALSAGKLEGKVGEQLMAAGNGKIPAGWVFFCGGGTAAGMNISVFSALVKGLMTSCFKAGFSTISLGLSPLCGQTPEGTESLIRELIAAHCPSDKNCCIAVQRKVDAGREA